MIKVYLHNLQGKIFKLLPMKEAYDKGVDNHIKTYIDNLYINYDGFFISYPTCSQSAKLIEVRNNLAYLKNGTDIELSKWRNVVLRSTRLIQEVIEQEEVKE